MQSPVLSDAKRKLLEKLLRGGGNRTSAAQLQIPLRAADAPTPLSLFQEQFWTHAQIVQGQPLFNETMTIVRHGPLDPRILERCFVQIVGRHESWRTTFDIVNGEPLQVVHPAAADFPIPVVDLRYLPERERDAEALRLGEADARRWFDLKKWPLLRTLLVRTDDEEYRLFMATHHLISDGVTAYNVFLPELTALYDALSREPAEDRAHDSEKASQLPALPVQYSDFAIWQREKAQRDIAAHHAEFWKQQLAGDLPVLAWPNDKPRPPLQTYRGAPYRFTVPLNVVDGVKALSTREGVSLYVTLFAAYAALLHRYTGQDDIIVGSLSGTRKLPEIERLAGCFLNMLPLRFDLSGDLTFHQLILRVRTVLLEALAHDEITFAEIVQAVRPRPDASRNPLFQSIFSIRPEMPPIAAGWEIRVEEILNGGSKLDLLFMLADQPGDMAGLLTYNPDVFEESTLRRMVDHWQILLAQVVARPDDRIAELEILTDEERRQLLFDFNDTQVDFPQRARLLHALFEEQAERTPSRSAVVFENESLTYRELNDRANQLAHFLQGKGVRPGTLVGVCLERSLNVVVALLGVLKAGGAYVPLDPSYPPDRLEYVAEDSGLSILLTQESLRQAWSHSRAELVCLDRDWSQIAASSAANPVTAAQPENLAYVIYTSGSTGRPKGVQITHHNVVNLVLAMQAAPGISSHDTLLAVTTISFDIAGLEIYVPLSVGAKIVLISRHAALNAREMARLLDQHQVTVMQAAPVTWRLLIESGWQPQPTLKILCGGEALPRDLAESLCARAGSVWNMYGPTETTIWSTCHRITADAPILIGRPIANTQVYVLDRALQLLPVGAIGELCIGGDGLARGYLNRADLTAEKFVAHPFLLGERLYRTGDLARFLPSGDLECLGRLDHQVKIRGFRIELGEIETAIAAWPGIRQAVVTARDNSAGDKRLVAYVVLADGANFQPAGLREALREKLPEYMIPASFVPLVALPLTSNGKINRQALPAPGEADAGLATESSHLAPANPDEQALAEIWAQVLGVERVGVTDTFFDLGGHSLLAVRITARAQAKWNIDLPPSIIFENPTVRLMAQAVASAQHHAARSQRPEIVPVPRQDYALSSTTPEVPAGALVFPMSFSQQQLWVLDQLQPGSAAYNIPLAIRLRGSLNERALQSALDSLALRHESLRTVFRVVNGKPSQVVLPSLSITMSVEDLRQLPEHSSEAERRRIAVEEARRPFDLSRGPLFSARLICVADSDHVLVFNVHHIVFDYSSIAVLIRDLSTFYDAACRGAEPSLPALPMQYPDYAVRQRDWMQGAALDPQLAYWKNQLKGVASSFELPTDHPRGSDLSFAGEFLTELFPARVLEAFESLQRREGVSLFMALLAAFEVLLYRHTNQEDVVVGASTAGRNRESTDDLIGFFVNPVVIRSDLSGNPTFRQLLQRVRKTATEAYDNQDLPFEKLVEQLRLRPDPSRNPLFQTMFLFQELAAGAVETPGLHWRWEGIDNRTAKFDLSAYVEKSEEGLFVAFEYNTDLFEKATVQRLMQHYRVLLESMVANPDQSIERLPMLGEAERRQLVVEFNHTAVDYPEGSACLHEIIERQIERAPDQVAVVFKDQSFTYRHLNERANQLAHHLRKHGVGPGAVVGICVERSLEMEVALLAILKAGGAYMPLDPEYPSERLAWMLDDAKPPIVLSQQAVADRLPLQAIPVFLLDSEWHKLESESTSNPGVAVRPADLAYVIYTSGSTGKPKGVLNVHQGIVNRLLWMQSEYNLTPADRVLQKTPYSFDVSVWELFWPLMTGATLVMAQPGGHRDPSYLAQLMLQEKITTTHFVPSMLRAFLETAAIPKHSSLRQVFCSGEALAADLQNRFFQMSDAALHNLYGPTEAAVDVTYWACRRDDPRLFVPIGRPIANIQIYILDARLQPAPLGVAGELHIGGIGVARGYLNRPELTAERFIPDPFRSAPVGGPALDPAVRLYKTGDLARYLPGGEIEYLGRLDHQVKIRGFRIELGEIEAVIRQSPGILETVVVAREDTPGDKRLVAYVALAKPDSLNADELRESLRTSLPEHMIPAAFVPLAELPLTSSGKIDRRALPAPNYESAQPGQVHLEPRNQTEKSMATIWAEVLQLGKIGIHDNFFELGGHSLLAVRLFAQISRTFGKTVSMNTLFLTPTIAELSRLIDSKADVVPKNRLIAIQSQGSKPPLFWFPGGAGSVLAFREASLLLGTEQPVYGLESKLPGPGEVFEDVEVRARHFVQIIQSLQPEGPYNLAGFCSGGLVAYETARLLEAQGDSLGLVALVESVPFHYPGEFLGTINYYLQHYSWRANQMARRWYRWVAESFFGASPSNIPTHDELFPLAVQTEDAMAEVHRIEEAMRLADSRYRPRPLNTRVCLLVGEDDYFGKGVGRSADPRLAWRPLLSAGFDIVAAPGDHLWMLRAPRVKVFAKRLEASLAEAATRAAESVRAGRARSASKPPVSSVESGAPIPSDRTNKIPTRSPR
jgi:amino acid adenylation domain-containing protein